MIDFLLNFLGIQSWYIDFYLSKKRKIKKCNKKCNKNIKSLNLLNLLEDETPSPKLSIYDIRMYKKPTPRQYFNLIMYNIYSLLILILLSIQPIYTLYMYSRHTENIKFLSSFFMHVNIPIIYIWEKIYFKTNHFEQYLLCKKFKFGIISASTVISILVNFIDMPSFYNEYYWLNYISGPLFFILISIEWLYSRLVLFLFVYCFIFIMNSHILRFKKVIKDIENNEFNFEENTCLSNLISEITSIRHEIEITISNFNNIISLTTVFGGISLAIFIRDIFPTNKFSIDEINFETHDRYLMHPMTLYVFSQIILLINMSRYSFRRDEILKYIKSINFINRFLSRMSVKRVMNKTKDINVVTLNIIEETATTIDWLILGNILSEKWLDFTIFGISTSDGQLIKKSITLGGTLLFLLSFTLDN